MMTCNECFQCREHDRRGNKRPLVKFCTEHAAMIEEHPKLVDNAKRRDADAVRWNTERHKLQMKLKYRSLKIGELTKELSASKEEARTTKSANKFLLLEINRMENKCRVANIGEASADREVKRLCKQLGARNEEVERLQTVEAKFEAADELLAASKAEVEYLTKELERGKKIYQAGRVCLASLEFCSLEGVTYLKEAMEACEGESISECAGCSDYRQRLEYSQIEVERLERPSTQSCPVCNANARKVETWGKLKEIAVRARTVMMLLEPSATTNPCRNDLLEAIRDYETDPKGGFLQAEGGDG